MTYVCI